MSKTTSFMIILITYSVSSCGPSTNDALDYFDTIISFQEDVIEKEELLQDAIMALIEDADETSEHSLLTEEQEKQYLDHVDEAHATLLSSIDTSLHTLRQLEDFNNSSMLREAAITLLASYREVAMNEYISIIKLLRKPPHTFSQSDHDYFNELWVKQVNLKLNKAIEDFTRAQLEYAQNWNFDLEEQGLH